MAPETCQMQVLKVDDHFEQHILELPVDMEELPALDPLSVRIKVRLVSMSAANLHYAALKSEDAWWTNYPIPEGAPAPINDNSVYGCVPTWGFCEVLQSTCAIPVGTLLYGFMPLSSFPTDFTVGEISCTPGVWVKDRSARLKGMDTVGTMLMITEYSHYDAFSRDQVEHLAWFTILRSLWASSYMLNRFVYSDGTYPQVHPHHDPRMQGDPVWTPDDADLSRAVVVQLAAGAKTAQSLAFELLDARKPGTHPLGLLGFTSVKGLKVLDGAPFPVRYVGYSEVASDATMDFIAELKPSKLVVFDYGASEGKPQEFFAKLKQTLPDVPVHNYVIGLSHNTIWAGLPANSIKTNPSLQRDDIIKLIGRDKLLEDMAERWKSALDNGRLTQNSLHIGKGMKGPDGVEGVWNQLVRGDFSKASGLAFEL